jgi:signal transduction histidine kinase
MNPEASLPNAAAPTVSRPWRGLLFTSVLCVTIAIVITVLDRGGFGVKLVYSFAIGLCCWALIDGLRLAVNALARRARQRRGETAGGADLLVGWRGMVPLALLAMLLGPLLGLTIGDALTGGRSTSLLQFGATSTRLTLAFSVIGTLAAVFAVSTMERLAAARAGAERAQRVAAEAQLRLLQSQLEPHMLFNTLANLRVLIGTDAARAQAMVDHLNAFLRATLSASRAAQHPLADEFARLADYLALMAVRMGPRLQVRLDLPAELAALPVPPLLLQPLVENSIKHGLEPQVAGGRIEITARRDGRQLVLQVRDTGAGPGAAATGRSGGFGLAQVRERLATVYGGSASLALQAAGDAEGGTLATLHLPLS